MLKKKQSKSKEKLHRDKIAMELLQLILNDIFLKSKINWEKPPNTNSKPLNTYKSQLGLNNMKLVHEEKMMNVFFMNKVSIPNPTHKIGKTINKGKFEGFEVM
jgi:hypothetical protein